MEEQGDSPLDYSRESSGHATILASIPTAYSLQPTVSARAQPAPCDPDASGLISGTDLAWAGALLVGVLLFYWPVLFGGETVYFRDAAAYHYPQACVTRQALLEGRIPHWEPRIGGGYPYQSDPHSLVFYPLSVLLLLGSPLRAFNLFTVAHVPLGGLFLFWLLRRWQLSRPASALGATAFMFCGLPVALHAMSPQQHGLAWIPVALVAFDHFLAAPTAAAFAATALAVAAQGSGSDPQFVLFTALFLGLVPWLRPAKAQLGAGRAVLGGLAALATAGLLLAYQYLPLAQFVMLSERAGGLALAGPFTYDLKPWNLLNLILPVSFADPASPLYKASFAQGLIPMMFDSYVGVPLLVLAFVSLAWRAREQAPEESTNDGQAPMAFWRTARLGWLLALAAVALSLGGNGPFLGWLTAAIPPLRSFRFAEKYLTLAAVALPIVAALGVQALGSGQTRPLRFALGGSATAGLCCLAGLVAVQLAGPRLTASFLGSEGGGPLHDAMCQAWSANLLFATAMAGFLAALVGLTLRGKLEPRVSAGALAALTALDLVMATHGSFPHSAPEMLTGVPPVAGRMLQDCRPNAPPVRFAVVEPPVTPSSPSSTVFESHVYKRNILRTERGVPLGLDALHETGAIPLRAHVALVGTLLAGSREQRLRTASAAGVAWTLWTNPDLSLTLTAQTDANPRAFVARRARAWSGPEPGQHLPVDRLPDEALFEPPEGENSPPDLLEPRRVDTCVLEDYRPDSLRVRFDLQGRGLLVVLDAFYPGWEATVDGHPRAVSRVAGFFRGVAVQEGEQVLEMRFVPRPFRLGAGVSLATLLGLALACLSARRRRALAAR